MATWLAISPLHSCFLSICLSGGGKGGLRVWGKLLQDTFYFIQKADFHQMFRNSV